jgi:hypothetical protein
MAVIAPGYLTGHGLIRGRFHEAFQWCQGKHTSKESTVTKACCHTSCGGKRCFQITNISFPCTNDGVPIIYFGSILLCFRKWRAVENHHLYN